MNIEKLPNGDLEITANVNEQHELKTYMLTAKHDLLTPITIESMVIAEFLDGNPMGDGISYEQVRPEEVGALTDAPLISDGNNIFGYMDDAITSFVEELAAGRPVKWIKA